MGIKEYIKLDENQRCIDSYQRCVDQQYKLNASISLIDPNQQLKKAKEGKLYKIPYALKDNVNTKGILTTAGSRILDNYYPIYNATIYNKLIESGAVLVSKANMDELAMGGTNKTSYFGPCSNPYDLKRVAGGSSGGSAALVASGAVAFSIGSDTGDSIRKPASFCGIVGVKPTYGRISRYGIVPYANSLDHVGYFTSNVEDAATLLEVLSGRDDKDMTSSNEPVLEYSELLSGNVKDKKILIFKNVINSLKKYPENLALFNNVIEGLKQRGAIVDEMEIPSNLMRAIFPTYYVIANCESTANHANLDGLRFGHSEAGHSMEEIIINTRSKGFGPDIKKRFVVGAYSLDDVNQNKIYRKAQKVRRLIVEAYKKEIENADCVIAPCGTGMVPLIKKDEIDYLSDEYLVAENHMVIGNFSGYPSMSVPMGFIKDLPIGVNITCNPFKEDVMFDIALAIEDITGLKNKIKEDF